MDKDKQKEFEERIKEQGKRTVAKYLLSAQMHKEFEWERFMYEIPKISFPKEWKVQLQPPYMTAIARFVAYDGDEKISVYLDGFNTLGIYRFGSFKKEDIVPYWEAYEIEGETFRCDMNDTEELINVMKDEFKRRRTKDGQ